MTLVRAAAHAVTVDARPDGLRVVNREPLEAYGDTLIARLDHWALTAPERTFIAERDAAGAWRRLSYADARRGARAVAQALLERGLSPERPLAILSESGIDHALLTLGAMLAGVPAVPVSPAYSLVSTDFGKLRDVLAQVTPGLVFASDALRYAPALERCVPADVELAVSGDAGPTGRAATAVAALLGTPETAAVDAAQALVGPETVAKILFTSGSTGSPKGVINTHRMLASNQQMLRQTFPFVVDEPPVIVDWLPWHHTFGGNHNVGLVLNNGGTLYVSAGKPTSAAAFAPTLANLRELAPTIHFDVPRGFAMLTAALEQEPALRERFFSRLRMAFYAGAGIAPPTWDALHALARANAPQGVLITTSLGSTETAPAALAASWQTEAPGMVGIPLPGVEIKLVPDGEKYELRLRGPNISPGYWRNAALTAEAFDAEGYYRIGDALRFVDPAEPARGFVFDGRIAEDFKLGTGTWVSAGPLRVQALAHFGPLVTDLVVSGETRAELGALVFLDQLQARAVAVDVDADAALDELYASPRLRAVLAERLAALARSATGSSSRIVRLLPMLEPASLDAGEITDKGSLNARAILRRRAALVDDLHAASPSAQVIVLADV